MFLHLDIFHITGNMLFLYIFGDNVEDALGHVRFLIFYLLCGLVADFAHILSLTTQAELMIPTLGASGAISGVLGAYIVMYPRAKVLTLLLIRLIWIVPIPAAVFIGFWFLLQLLYTALNMGGGVAYWAHIGGFVAGVALIFILRRAHIIKERNPEPLSSSTGAVYSDATHDRECHEEFDACPKPPTNTRNLCPSSPKLHAHSFARSGEKH